MLGRRRANELTDALRASQQHAEALRVAHRSWISSDLSPSRGLQLARHHYDLLKLPASHEVHQAALARFYQALETSVQSTLDHRTAEPPHPDLIWALTALRDRAKESDKPEHRKAAARALDAAAGAAWEHIGRGEHDRALPFLPAASERWINSEGQPSRAFTLARTAYLAAQQLPETAPQRRAAELQQYGLLRLGARIAAMGSSPEPLDPRLQKITEALQQDALKGPDHVHGVAAAAAGWANLAAGRVEQGERCFNTARRVGYFQTNDLGEFVGLHAEEAEAMTRTAREVHARQHQPKAKRPARRADAPPAAGSQQKAVPARSRSAHDGGVGR